MNTLTVHSLSLTGRKQTLYGSLRRNRKVTLDNTTLAGLAHARTRAIAKYKETESIQYKWEIEYINHNIGLLMLVTDN